jgi:hypothetical protein
MGRRLLQLLVAVLAAAAPLALAVPAARADDAGSLLAMVNNLRASHGVAPLASSPTLSSVAQAWSAHMAAGNTLGHNPNLASQAGGGWTKLGENVAGAGNITAAFNAFVNSSFHLGNMLDPAYNVTGIGVAVGSGGMMWVTEDFEGLPGASSATTTPPTTRVTATTGVRAPAPSGPPAAVPRTTAPTPPASGAGVSGAPPTAAGAAGAAVAAVAPPTTTAVTTSPPDSADGGGAAAAPSAEAPRNLAAAARLPVSGQGHPAASRSGLLLAVTGLAATGLALVALAGGALCLKRGLPAR